MAKDKGGAVSVDASQGAKKVLYLRLRSERPFKDAQRLPLQTKHTIKEDRSVDTAQTKDGGVAAGGAYTSSIDIEALDVKNNPVADMMHYAMQNNLKLEAWELDFDDPVLDDAGKPIPNTYHSLYNTGLLNGWEADADVENNSTIKTTLVMDGPMLGGQEVVESDEIDEVKLYYHILKGEQGIAPEPLYEPQTKTETPVNPTP
ncbi:phage major tail protein, TP901-1 family [Lactobacillus sp. CC-MHH1034]|uniref:phage major tail protein, TP901-1 family n=1 Tax=Agrilactobacillus fermenti TaxID=2586909 RepID=UPI001E631688|nr:phage major tail protein, TP901-1 family [Agrilactobacillus fermenti]MCD2255776.1 phage major tail protein, TP901-1 family [Agrilactobacillus fermenti]